MSFERYTQIFDGYEQGRLLRAGGKGTAFSFSARPTGQKYRLFVTGETNMFYQWKDEPDYPAMYHAITDALDPHHALEAQYCLNLSSARPEKYVRRIYKKTLWPPVLSYMKMSPVPEDWTVGVWACAQGLTYAPGGYLRMLVEVRYRREGISRRNPELPADETVVIDFPQGDYDWRSFQQALHLPCEKIAYVGVWIEGCGYSGEFYIERPFLTGSTGQNLLPDFAQSVHDKEKFDWTAQYLSRKEWPELRVTLNDQTVFEGEVFERCHVASEWSFTLPEGAVQEDNTLEVELISSYHDPLPYTIREVGLIEQPCGPVVLLAAASSGVAGGAAGVLIRTEKAHTRIRFEFPEGKLSGAEEMVFEEAGLHGVSLSCCHQPCEHARFRLYTDDCVLEGEIARIVEKTEQQVLTGTGDLIYINQNMEDVEEYLSWYVSNQIGNLMTIRPTYRWSGTRLLNPQVWKTVVRVLNGLGMKYPHMMDGRELPGIGGNPDVEMLSGAGFLGRQNHEHDGSQFYAGQGMVGSPTAEQQSDMGRRAWEEDPTHVNYGYSGASRFYIGDAIYGGRAPHTPHDMRLAEEARVAQLQRARGGVLRHTGPAHMFKYFLKAGYEWIGAETMYGTMEPLMACLRGAQRWKGLPGIGVHHAPQWSSSPHDAPERFRRYRLALYVSYMQGATEINTEEGLWHLEEYYAHFHRFSKGCTGHLQQQQDFFRYVSTHSRTGDFHAPMALLHGRHDGWHGFINQQPWGWVGLKNTDAENSWDLLKVIYPLAKPGDALYIHGCPTDRPVGYHTGTPLGNVDTLPVECSEDVFARYPAMAFMGYNCMNDEDCRRLEGYVRAGGKLLMTRAHMTLTTNYEDIASGRLQYAQQLLTFAEGAPQFAKAHVQGVEVEVCINPAQAQEILARTDEGLPLVLRYNLDKGSVILVNANAYPAHAAIRPVYEQLLESAMRTAADQEPVWVECGDDVQFTAYDQPDGSRHLYLLAVDWYRQPDTARHCRIRIGRDSYNAHMPFGVMLKVVSDGMRAAWPHSENGEVLSLTSTGARVQGTGCVSFTLAQGGAQRDVTVCFDQASVQEISF